MTDPRFKGIPAGYPQSRFKGIPVQAPRSHMQRTYDFAAGAVRGLTGTLGLPVDILAAAARPFGYKGQPVGGSESLLNLAQKAGLGGEAAPEGQFAQRVGEEVGAGLPFAAAPMGLVAAGARMAGPVGRAVRAGPAQFAAAELGSAAAGGVGAAIAQQVAPESLPAELLGQAAGALSPTVAAGAVRGAMRGRSPATVRENLNTFRSAGTTPTAGQAAQTMPTQTVESVLGAAPGGTQVLSRTAERQAGEMGSRVSELARSLAPRAGPETAGRQIQKGISGFVTKEQGKAGVLWDRVDKLIPPDTPTGMRHTRTLLADMTGKGKLANLFVHPTIGKAAKAVAEAGDSVGYQELRDLRSVIGAKLGSVDLISDIPRSDLKRLYGSLTHDIKTVAAEVGGDIGRRSFDRASRFTKALHGRVDDVLEPIAKRASPEKVFDAVAKADVSTLRAVKRSLEPREWRVVAASVAQDLGAAKPHLQDEVGEIFSPQTFLTSWNKLKPEVRSLLFGGRDLKAFEADLGKVAKAAAQVRTSSRLLSNPSGTAPLGANLLAGGVAIGGIASGNPKLAAVVAVQALSANAAAHLMSSPRFVRWLAKTTEVPAARLPGHLGRLSRTLVNESEQVQEAAEQYLDLLGT